MDSIWQECRKMMENANEEDGGFMTVSVEDEGLWDCMQQKPTSPQKKTKRGREEKKISFHLVVMEA